MNYKNTIDYLDRLESFGSKLGLGRIKTLLAYLGNPEKALKVIQIGGTKGKGSTAKMIYTILREAGYAVGLYTSPHLDDFRERIIVNDKPIPRNAVVKGVQKIRRFANKIRATHFEIVTALAFDYFKGKTDYTVIEVGLGGRLDATTITNPIIGIITNVELDHTDVLGNTIRSIVREKVGIIKPGMIFITSEKKKEALAEMKKACKKNSASLVIVKPRRRYNLKLIGEHQQWNAACAAKVCSILGISEKMIKRGLEKTVWSGRIEVMQRKPLIIFDVAHNPSSMKELRKTLNKYFKHRKLFLIFAMKKGKLVKETVRELPKADEIVLSSFSIMPCTPPKEIKKYINHKNIKIIEPIKNALRYVRANAGKDDLILLTGSLFAVSEGRRCMKFNN